MSDNVRGMDEWSPADCEDELGIGVEDEEEEEEEEDDGNG